MAIMALTHADELRELSPVGADEVLAATREATGLTDKALRSVTLPDGSAVLVDADCERTDDEIRAAVEDDEPAVGVDPQHDQDVTPKPQ